MVELVQPTFEKLTKAFKTHETKKYKFRLQQLHQVLKGLKEMETEICEAMRSDLGRDMFLNYIAEVAFLEASVKHDCRHLKKWMEKTHEEIELLLCPGSAYTVYEPLGVVGVFGSWNAPFVTTMKPLIQAIAAGNCVIVKPSEHSPQSSAAIKKFCDKYLDPEYIVVIEGAVDVAVAINQLPLDLICFTGSTQVGKLIA